MHIDGLPWAVFKRGKTEHSKCSSKILVVLLIIIIILSLVFRKINWNPELLGELVSI